MSTYNQHSEKLISCLISLENENTRSSGKMALIEITSTLMPHGKPLYAEVAKYRQITALVAQYGRKTILKAIMLMVKDFCNSVNVVRNMNEDQMIEAAAMMLDECGNFRLEDYQMMFSMGKRGQFPSAKLMDRVDIQYISLMMDEYWIMRHRAGKEREKEIEENKLQRALIRGGQRLIGGPEIKPISDAQMDLLNKALKDTAAAMGQPLLDIEKEEEFKKIRAEYKASQMKQKAASGELKTPIRIVLVENTDNNEKHNTNNLP